MDIVISLKEDLKNCFQSLGKDISLNDIVIEKSKTVEHGDYSTNIALKYARLFGCAPIELAKKISEKIDMTHLDKVEIAGPGFINFFIKQAKIVETIKKIIDQDERYGRQEKKNIKINLEFVSANPTGLLHVGTARCAAIGDSLARILDFDGYDVTKEYYINDAGSQIDHLAQSIQARYAELFGIPGEIPEDGYMGQDVVDIAKQIKEQYGDKFIKEPDFALFKLIGVEKELSRIKDTLHLFGVDFDVFSSEKQIRKDGAIEKEINNLKEYVYENEGAKLLRTTAFLDDKDRVIQKGNGEYTYFMPDICYHLDKLSRGFDQLIDILGADHHGYVNRMKSALMMHGYKEDVLDIILVQMVRFIQNGVEIKASKRSGNAITLQELIEDIGKDATRYFFAMRNQNNHMDFDLSLAVEQSSNNPAYYAQYAHARLSSILQSAKDIEIDVSGQLLKEESEMELLKHIASFPDVIDNAAKERATYKITNYIHDLAEKIHVFYSECRVINREDVPTTASRLALVKACKIVMKNALYLIGVSAPEHM